MEDSRFFLQYQVNVPLDYSLDLTNVQFPSENHNPQISNNNSNSNIKALQASTERTVKQLDINGWNSSTSGHITPKVSPSSSFQIISLRESDSPQATSRQVNNGLKESMKPKNEAGSPGNIKLPPKHVQETKRVGLVTRTRLHPPDHIIAERNRREKIHKGFIALSALVPGRKKMDKASVLEDALNYLKQLQERAKTLEEQAAKRAMESMIIVKKSRLSTDDETSSSDDSRYLPEIEVRVSDRDVLIRIHCEKNKGSIVNILTEIEKIQLTIVDSKVLSFGSTALDITVVAQMDAELTTTAKDLARNLLLALGQFM